MIVDAHSHIFSELRGQTGQGVARGLDYGRAQWGSKEIQFLPPFAGRLSNPSDVVIANMDWAGVDKAVLLQGPFYGECNQYVLEALGRFPTRLIGAAYMDPWMASAREALETILAVDKFRAVKLECSEAAGLCGLHEDAQLDSPDLLWLWDALDRHGLVLTLDLGAVGTRSYQTAAVRGIAEAHPNLRIVIADLGQPTPPVEADPLLWTKWQEQIDLGHLPNIWFDASALVAYLPEESYPYPTAARYLQLAVERIGSHRIMWGTDQPGTLIHATYRQYVEMARHHTRFLSQREQALVLGENALAVYG